MRPFIHALLFSAAVLTTATSAQTAASQRIRNVILVHGAWADGSSWSKVIPLLKAKGLNVVAVQMPLTSFADDVATVRRAIALESGPAVLVGHSYGGMVITEAGNDPKIAGLVYVAAYAPVSGESADSLNHSVPASPVVAQVRPAAGGFLKLTQTGVYDDFAQDLRPSEKAILYAAQAPTNIKSLGGKNTAPAWRKKPSWYIIAANDRTIPTALEARMAKRSGAKTTTVQSSHVIMLTHPEAVAADIEQAVAGK